MIIVDFTLFYYCSLPMRNDDEVDIKAKRYKTEIVYNDKIL